jgi:hypothetical protein
MLARLVIVICGFAALQAAAPSASSEAFDAEIRAEAPHWKRLVEESGATIE